MKRTAEPGRGPIPKTVLLLIQGGFTAVAVLYLFLFWDDSTLSSEGILVPELLFTLHTAWAFWSWRLATGRLLDGYLLFFAFLVLFNGGQILLDAAGLLPEGLLDNVFSDAALWRAVLLVNASVCSFHMGALVRTGRAEQRSESSATVNPFVFRRMGLAFLLVSILPMLKRMIESVAIVVASGYFGLYQQTVKIGLGNWDAVLAAFFLPGILITFATAPRRRWNVRMCWALALVNATVGLFLGSRSAAGVTMIPMALLHHWLVRPLRTSIIVAAAIFGILLMPWVASQRNLNLEERLTTSAWSGQPARVAAVAGIKEIGGSMGTVAMAVELIPNRRQFDYGAGYLRALSTVVPNLFWDIHPALRAGLYGDWLIREVDPDTADRGGGLGFSVVAEAYANFSWLGTPLVMLAMGWLLAGLVVWARSGSEPARLSCEALTLSAIMLLPRGETATVVRLIVWTAVLPYLVAALSREEMPSSRESVPTVTVTRS
jgi:hypothetical protein